MGVPTLILLPAQHRNWMKHTSHLEEEFSTIIQTFLSNHSFLLMYFNQLTKQKQSASTYKKQNFILPVLSHRVGHKYDLERTECSSAHLIMRSDCPLKMPQHFISQYLHVTPQNRFLENFRKCKRPAPQATISSVAPASTM